MEASDARASMPARCRRSSPHPDLPQRGAVGDRKYRFTNWAELKAIFNTVDKVGELAVFDIGGNKYLLVAYVRFEKPIVYIKAVLTHRDYDKGAWKS